MIVIHLVNATKQNSETVSNDFVHPKPCHNKKLLLISEFACRLTLYQELHRIWVLRKANVTADRSRDQNANPEKVPPARSTSHYIHLLIMCFNPKHCTSEERAAVITRFKGLGLIWLLWQPQDLKLWPFRYGLKCPNNLYKIGNKALKQYYQIYGATKNTTRNGINNYCTIMASKEQNGTFLVSQGFSSFPSSTMFSSMGGTGKGNTRKRRTGSNWWKSKPISSPAPLQTKRECLTVNEFQSTV